MVAVLTCFSRSGFHRHSLLVHNLQGLRADVPRVDSFALHTQQQTAGKDGELVPNCVQFAVCWKMEEKCIIGYIKFVSDST